MARAALRISTQPNRVLLRLVSEVHNFNHRDTYSRRSHRHVDLLRSLLLTRWPYP